jgi:hypothetical protein
MSITIICSTVPTPLDDMGKRWQKKENIGLFLNLFGERETCFKRNDDQGGRNVNEKELNLEKNQRE